MSEIIYDTIGANYNNTRTADPFLVSRLLHFLQPAKDNLYLDIGCGTGNYTIALAEKGFNFSGIDPSEKMLKEAALKNQAITWMQGTAEQIPIKDKMFNGAIATLTVHHWKDLQRSCIELYRVLQNNSRLVLFTSGPEQMKAYWLNHYFPKMLAASANKMPSPASVRTAALNAGFEMMNMEKYFVQDELQDLFLYSGKNKPAIYFNENIRAGISSFALLAYREEVEKGLLSLKADLESGAFTAIQKQYENDLGDYLFIGFKK